MRLHWTLLTHLSSEGQEQFNLVDDILLSPENTREEEKPRLLADIHDLSTLVKMTGEEER